MLNELTHATYFLLHPNLYRITVRDQAGTISSRETRAASLLLSAHDLDEQSEIVKIERIDPSSREVLGGLYLEQDRRKVEQRVIPVSLEAESVLQKRQYDLTIERIHLYRINRGLSGWDNSRPANEVSQPTSRFNLKTEIASEPSA